MARAGMRGPRGLWVWSLAIGTGLAAAAADANGQCPGRWVPGIGSPGVDGPVYALAVLPEAEGGDVIVGGRFTMAGGIAANNIARYDPETNTWSAMGEGLSLPSTGGWYVTALAVIQSPAGVEVVAGMGQGLIAGVADRPLARHLLATGTWTTMALPEAWSVECLHVGQDGELLVGGFFGPNLPGGGGGVVQRYDVESGSWERLAGSANRGIHALADDPGGGLYVGGPFGFIGTTPGRILRREPTGQWTSLGTSPNNYVYAVVRSDEGRVYVGGLFSSVGGVRTGNVAEYNEAARTWSAMGAGDSGFVYALKVMAGGDLLVGGTFSLTNGLRSRGVARYHPATQGWTAMAGGVPSESVRALGVLPGGDVIVGGSFRTVDDQVANRVARFTFNAGPLTCTADFNCSGTTTVEDVYLYISEFLGRSPRADLNGDGVVGVQDLLDFVGAYFRGCP